MATEIETKPPATVPMDVVSDAPTADSPSSPSSATTTTTTKKKRKGSASANADVPELEVDLSLPEPPSKRAKRALKKGKTLPAKPKSDDDDDDDVNEDGGQGGKGSGAASGDRKKAERSKFGIWIGNLPFTVTRAQLFRWFVDSSGGAIAEADITRVNLPLGKRQPNQLRPHNVHADSASAAGAAGAAAPPPNKGFAYVDFATYEAQVAAAALSETELDGRRVLIKDSKSFEGRPAKEASGQAGADAAAESAGGAAGAPPAGSASTKVFVGNLGFDTTEEDLRRLFTPCGPVAWVKVATFPDNTEKCRGYGWVQFGGKTDEGGNVTPEVAATAAAAAVKGFVRIEEKIETEEDFIAEAGDDGEDDKEDEEEEEDAEGEAAASGGESHADGDKKAPATAKPSTTAVRTKTRKWWVNMLKGRPLKVQFAEDDVVRYKKRFRKGGPPQDPNQAQGEGQRRPRPDKMRDGGDKTYKSQDLSIAQRTGAITTSLGKKTLLE